MSQGEPWRATLNGVVVTCRLTPKGGRDAIDGVAERPDGTRVLLVRVRAPPEDGRANDALCALLAQKLRTPLSRVMLAAGGKSRVKRIAVGGDPEALVVWLRAL